MSEIVIGREKYVILRRESAPQMSDSISELVELGYRLHTLTTLPHGVNGVDYVAVMSLQEDSKYENITNLRDVAPSEVDDYLSKGWTVTQSWAKNIRMVKRG